MIYIIFMFSGFHFGLYMDIFFFASGYYMLNELVNRDSDTFYVLSLSVSSALIKFWKKY